MESLEGKFAWVTGAGTGIGEAAALEGMSIVLTGRRREPLQLVAGRIVEHGGKALVQPADIGEPNASSPSPKPSALRSDGSTFLSTTQASTLPTAVGSG